ncbi:RED-like protein N-terminal region-domain-containing protein [Flammula alnicola]|nr:RED-like protein N-terminal region-domain-containing protein [Flammula alnicola]
MDQDSFRQLLQTPRPGSSSALGAGLRSRGSLLAVPPKKKTVDASQPAFQPRNVKKTQDSKYRDRAAERRVGGGNDYAQVEAVLEEFEKKNADAEDKAKVEAQRKYLGGDSEHSILVKGLDFALLEQNKARSTLSSEDVDALDQAYLESSAHHEPTVPKKRTREDLIRELKEKRDPEKTGQVLTGSKSAEEESRLLEEAKQKGKFKPIGFKPIGSFSDGKKKKADTGVGEKRKKKKRKVDGEDTSESTRDKTASTSMPPPPVPITSSTQKPRQPQQEEPLDEDVDIFAGAGEYEGIDIGDDDEDEDDGAARPIASSNADLEEGEEFSSSSSAPRRWILSDEPEPIQANIPLPSIPPRTSSRSSPQRQTIASDDEDMQDQQPTRLVPLSSSAVPSIKDLLAMDKAAGSYDKKKKRKDKKKGGDGDEDAGESKKKSLEEKIDRDYKKLKTYTDKKAAIEGK